MATDGIRALSLRSTALPQPARMSDIRAPEAGLCAARFIDRRTGGERWNKPRGAGVDSDNPRPYGWDRRWTKVSDECFVDHRRLEQVISRFPTDRAPRDSGGAEGRHAGAGSVGSGGDSKFDAFSSAVLAALPRLRRYAIALLRDMSMADDLVQDCVERALKNRASLADTHHISGWLSSILHNLYMDSLRQQRRRGAHIELDDSLGLIELSVPPADRGTAKDLVEAMSDMSFEHRQVLLLVGLEGYSYRDVAAQLDIPIGTVMSRLARARAQLRSRLDGEAPVGEVVIDGSWPGRRAVK
jgi:RNA polymerase sigma factor (sigma-70 family)